MSRLADRVRELDAARSPGLWKAWREKFVRHLKINELGGHWQIGGNAHVASFFHDRAEANATLAAAFSPTALAAVEAMEKAVREHVSWCACGGCAVIRSWEQALGIAEEQSDGR